ncbi:hypothetical protein FKW77_009373 [Venturia effusa]|uniref:UDP-glucose:glycoprotein glucosyltransferase n=1 Tax=Venturia effusa TaxID=50376 RepID=A0A517L835_9PEZI|nr:hypothetical protein FKW77_009373 [Venturia effusa]
MRVPRWLLPTEILLLVGSLSLLPLAGAAPSINVGLQASFNSAPYLVELLETAAEEKPDVYFKILDRISDGYFSNAATDKELYEKFVRLLKNDNLITDSESLSSFELALSVHNAAPRIEAHYQYYRTTILPMLEKSEAKDCETWLAFTARQFCSAQFEKEDATIKGMSIEAGEPVLPFDRVYGPTTTIPAVIYADISSPAFKKFHSLISEAAKHGRVSYRVRHKPSISERQPLGMSGFGTELALKRTDYIVIDDRKADEEKEADKEAAKPADLDLVDEEVADLKPLTSSEVMGLGLKAATYVLGSEDPLETLVKLTQDFPKYSSTIAGLNSSKAFLEEHQQNRARLLPAGYNVMWINGVQYDSRKVDAFSLLDHMRRERALLGSFQEMEFSSEEAINLLTHPSIAEAQSSVDVQRYDWRDQIEGGNVIIWMNDIEKDKRYSQWFSDIHGLLQRGYPGQLPSVRKDIHNAIIPIDFSDPTSVHRATETVQDFVKRKIPIRFGLVPITTTEGAAKQAQVVYHILDSYGLGALMQYLEASLAAKKTASPHEATFKTIIEKRKLKADREAVSFQAVFHNEDFATQVDGAKKYLTRLGATGSNPPIFMNGVPIKNDDDWLQAMVQRVSQDLQFIQRGVFEETLTQDEWIPSIWLNASSVRRNPLVIPENDKDVQLLNLVNVFKSEEKQILVTMPTIPVDEESDKAKWAHIIVVGDFDTQAGLQMILESIKFRRENPHVQLVFVAQNGSPMIKSPRIVQFWPRKATWTKDDIQSVYRDVKALLAESYDKDAHDGTEFWPVETEQLAQALGFEHGQSGLIINGRKIGPIPADVAFTRDDFTTLYDFELKKRIAPASAALAKLEYQDKIRTVLDAAALCSLLAVSTVSDMPEGIFELPPPLRTRLYDEWSSSETAITVGDNTTALINIVAVLDPASELAQRWSPVIRVLSKLEGVSLKLFLNPKEALSELPVKRFYRYALNEKPSFDDDGAVAAPGIKFEGIPKDMLLTVAMDVPPSWLVAQKESLYDLDNVKLSSLPLGDNVDATYELENILIEGHTRESKGDQPPRGAQLVLSTAKDPHFADTIVMANLGYFQFKANPGYYNITLKPGLSSKIFKLDSAGALGYEATAGDETSEVCLLSFQGLTLYPRFSRNPGMEDEDVLGSTKSSTASDLAHKGADLVDGLLNKAGIKKSKAVQSAQADINIFSVASGHLYERMLNIMMVSVMRHTKHTVKFWFIEQFLSSSFKSFLPTLAKEYGFKYEMVTYKWPHWLRAQKEKQREIWGYKILFLDVLFPLDLDKVIFVDADQIVRTDMYELVTHDLKGAPYGFTPMCDSRVEMEGFRFWKQGYWKSFLRGLPYHISALYVVDLKRFRQMAAGDRLRQQYHQLSADPASLSNLDQDLPNNMQMMLPIHSLPQEWLWCETWCSDESLKDAKTIDLCNNPQTKEPKLDRARRQVPEWTEYDNEIAALAKRTKQSEKVPTGDEQAGTQGRPKESIEESKSAESTHSRDEL